MEDDLKRLQEICASLIDSPSQPVTMATREELYGTIAHISWTLDSVECERDRLRAERDQLVAGLEELGRHVRELLKVLREMPDPDERVADVIDEARAATDEETK